jgi:hypothetical protein
VPAGNRLPNNRSADRRAFIFIADEMPLHTKLGSFQNRA